MRRRMRVVGAVAATTVLVLVAAACSGGDGSDVPEEGAAGAGASFDVSLTEFAISPPMIDAPADQALTFEVRNDGTAPHSFAVDTGAGVESTPEIQPGEIATLEVPALAAGTYETLCTVSGHKEAGMVGSLMVAAGGAVAGPAAGPSGAAAGTTGGTVSMEEMLSGHEAGVAAFPAETEGQGNQLLEPTIDDGVKVFDLTATEVEWETMPGVFVDAMAYNGTVPGPEIRVNAGDRVRIVVHNEMTQPTIMHFHGLTVPNDMDGVPYITQDPILPGDFFTYEFEVVDPAGMYVYHSHFNSTEQVGKGLYGAFYVQPRDDDWGAVYGGRVDVEHTLFIGDGPTGYVLNGKEFPATQPIVAELGDTVLIHLANDGAQIHPMHLHGFHFEVVAEDGFVLDRANRYTADTLMVAPGQRFDVIVDARYPGVWAYHCHILPHVEGPHGMYGMVTALVVQ
jgi:FtsP/CotA-like multicopper oxidase with cupredoxin domain